MRALLIISILLCILLVSVGLASTRPPSSGPQTVEQIVQDFVDDLVSAPTNFRIRFEQAIGGMRAGGTGPIFGNMTATLSTPRSPVRLPNTMFNAPSGTDSKASAAANAFSANSYSLPALGPQAKDVDEALSDARRCLHSNSSVCYVPADENKQPLKVLDGAIENWRDRATQPRQTEPQKDRGSGLNGARLPGGHL